MAKEPQPHPIDLSGHAQPEQGLLTYYLLTSFLAGPFFPFAFAVLYFRFRSLRYHFTQEGVSMSWGVVFRREIHLTYSRIQDIHLVSNAVERWLGLGRIQVQTASGSAKAEMTIEGFAAFRELRDFLYSRMRGAAEPEERQHEVTNSTANQSASDDELVTTLQAVARELQELRLELAASRGDSQEAPDV